MSNPEARVIIGTTIAPQGDLANQKEALSGWMKAGFEVVAVNTSAEIEMLAAEFPGVCFSAADTDGQERFGKPYIYLHSLLQALGKQEASLYGVVNSDIHLVDNRLREFVCQQATDSFLFGSRVDVTSLADFGGGSLYRGGFDYFFFNRKLLSIYPEEEFCLGLPWWDYWIVLVPIARGIMVKRVDSPVVAHLAHSMRFSFDQWVRLGITLSKYFTPSFPIGKETMHNYLQVILHMIESNPNVKIV